MLSGSPAGPARAANIQGEEGWERGGAVSQPPARGVLVSVRADVHLGVSFTHSTCDAVANNPRELNITVPAVIQPLMLSSHGIICQGPSPAFTGWFCWCQIPAELAKPSGMSLHSNLFRFKTFTTVLKAGRSFACGRVLGY